jgi:hypothetical protein
MKNNEQQTKHEILKILQNSKNDFIEISKFLKLF